LYHHNYFELRLGEELDRAKRYRNPLSLAMVDVDFFKKVNDEHGHRAGDQVLQNLAELLKKATRLSDIAARYGGEEFALVLPCVEEQDMRPFGERLRKDVEAYDFNGIRVTISVGVVYFDGGRADFNMENFIETADNALYRAKNNGRNRVEVVSLRDH
jgi:diguanylate cyclase (GGDEF)-like protein